MGAVATHQQGFRTLGELLIPFGFHFVVSVAGLQLLLVAARMADAVKAVATSPEPLAE